MCHTIVSFLQQVCTLKGALDKYNIIAQLFPKKLGEVLAWVMTECLVLYSGLTYL